VRSIAQATAIAVAFALSSSVVLAQPGSRDALARARVLDREGAKAYSEGRFEDAIRSFEEAYRLGGPAFEIWNIAKCQLRLDRPEQAAASLKRFLGLPNIPKEDREEVTRQLEALEKRSSKLTVTSVPSGAEVSVDGSAALGRTPLSTTITPGPHTVLVSIPSRPAISRDVEARFGQAVNVEAAFGNDERSSLPNPYGDRGEGQRIALRAGYNVVLPRYGSVGGNPGVGFLALGTYKVAELGSAAVAVGGLVSVTGDSWRDRTGLPNNAVGCAPLGDVRSATALSAFAIGEVTVPIARGLRATGLAGVGAAGYFVDDVGGDVFVPSCRSSPGVRPALLFGARIDYAISSVVRLSAFPLSWQVQPAFDGARGTPRDASGVWMKFGFGIGAGVDL
jgi:hypothetical protein